MADETQQAVEALRAVAHGIYPPLLESEGLEAALRAVERTALINVQVAAADLGRYDRQTEETVYFCVLEAVEQARMSGAAGLRATIEDPALAVGAVGFLPKSMFGMDALEEIWAGVTAGG